MTYSPYHLIKGYSHLTDPFFMKNKKQISLRKQVTELKRKKLACLDVVDLDAYRKLSHPQHRRKLLVIDDEPIMRSALQRILESNGYEVLLGEDGLDLSNILETHTLDMILLDINLPFVDGLELCSILKQSPLFSKLPILVLSGHNSEEDIENAFRSGACDFITKPFEIDDLLERIDRHMEQSSSLEG